MDQYIVLWLWIIYYGNYHHGEFRNSAFFYNFNHLWFGCVNMWRITQIIWLKTIVLLDRSSALQDLKWRCMTLTVPLINYSGFKSNRSTLFKATTPLNVSMRKHTRSWNWQKRRSLLREDKPDNKKEHHHQWHIVKGFFYQSLAKPTLKYTAYCGMYYIPASGAKVNLNKRYSTPLRTIIKWKHSLKVQLFSFRIKTTDWMVRSSSPWIFRQSQVNE